MEQRNQQSGRSDVDFAEKAIGAPASKLESMEFILFIYLKTKSMKKWNWKSVLLYVVRIVELIITGAAGGVAGSVL